ncbi:MAG: hypothetical protein OHK0012_06550 [Synechococcales cyanobacterium]
MQRLNDHHRKTHHPVIHRTDILPGYQLWVLQDSPTSKADPVATATALAQVACWQFQVSGGQAIWNEHQFTLMGLSPQHAESHYQTWRERVHPGDLTDVEARLHTAIQTGHPLEVEYRLILPDGQERWVMTRGTPITNPGGQVEWVAGIMVDITDRKQRELHLNDQANRLRILTENIPAAIFRYLLRPDGSEAILELSPGSRDLWEVDPQVVEQDIHVLWAMIHPEDIPAMRDSILHSGQTLTFWEHRWRITTPSGRQKWMYGKGQPQRQPNGDIIWDSIIQDVTEDYQQQLHLAEQEYSFRSLAENLPDSVVRLDRQQRILYINPAGANISGIPMDICLGRTHRELGFPLEMVREWEMTVAQVIQTQAPCTYESALRTPTGDIAYALVSVVPEWDATGTVQSVLAISRDITPLKQAERALHQQVTRERLLNLVIHNIRHSLDLSQILTTAVREVRHVLAADRVIIYRLSADGQRTLVAESVGDFWASASYWPEEETVDAATLEAYQRGSLLKFHDASLLQLPLHTAEAIRYLEIKAKLAAPILCGPRLWGYLCVHHCAAPHYWQDWEEQLLKDLTNQLSVAVQQSQLFAQVRQFNESLEVQVKHKTEALEKAVEFDRILREITYKIRDTLDENSILETVVQELALGLHLSCCDTGIYNDNQTLSTTSHEYTKLPISAKGQTWSIPGMFGIYVNLLQGKHVQFCMLDTQQNFTENIRHQQLTVLACPMQDHASVLGDIWLFKPAGEVFSQAEIDLVMQVAAYCAIAIRQSRLYQAAQAQVQELERLNRLKDDFLSTISHELRTPMSNIKMAMELLQRRLSSAPELNQDPSIQRYLQIMKSESDREIHLISNLLDLTRLDAEILPLTIKAVDLSKWLTVFLQPFQRRAQEAELTLQVALSQAMPRIHTDVDHVQRIVSELLINALKYTPQGETILVDIHSSADHWHLTISNSGVTIPEDEQARIFDRFYRIPYRDPWKYGGTGLGLSLVKKLTEFLGGTITLHVEEPWVRFRVSLPLLSSPTED